MRLYRRRDKWIDVKRIFRRELQRYEQAVSLEHTAPIDTVRGLYKAYAHHCITLRQELDAKRHNRSANLSDDEQARDIIASLANLCDKVGRLQPSFLGLLGRMLIWTGKDDEAVIAFQH